MTKPTPKELAQKLRYAVKGAKVSRTIALHLEPELVDDLIEALERADRLESENARFRKALIDIRDRNFGICPILDDPNCRHLTADDPCPKCGDLGLLMSDPKYDPEKDGHCVARGPTGIAYAALKGGE